MILLILNGPNLNLLGEREQSQYGSITFDQLKKNCLKKANELNINLNFYNQTLKVKSLQSYKRQRKNLMASS